MKKIWLTSLDSSKETVQSLMTQMKTYGIELTGHFWTDDLDKMAWAGPREELLKSDVALWAILTSSDQLFSSSNLYGLSLLAMTVRAKQGAAFPVVFLQTQGKTIEQDQLPTHLKGVDVMDASNQNLGAKLIAKVHSLIEKSEPEYRMDVYGTEQIGQWFEVGPVNDLWQGVMFGVSGAEIGFQAVGPKGELPQKSELHYPVQGLKLTLGEKEYTAWAVQNRLDAETSYYAKVTGFPGSILFGPYGEEESADAYVTTLK